MRPISQHSVFDASQFVADLRSTSLEPEAVAQREKLHEFCVNLTVCQTVIPELDGANLHGAFEMTG